MPIEPAAVVDAVVADLQAVVDAHAAPARTLPPPAEPHRPPAPELPQQPRGPSVVAPERFALLQALLAFLLARCGESASARVETAELELRFQLTPQELKESLELLNLVNFGGGCYAVYCHSDNGDVVVDKELYGDAFRRPARLSPLEAKALLRALDVVAPLVAAEANTSLQTVRAKVEAAFGRFPLADTPMPQHEDAEERAVTILNEGVRNRRLVDITYLSRSSDELSRARSSPTCCAATTGAGTSRPTTAAATAGGRSRSPTSRMRRCGDGRLRAARRDGRSRPLARRRGRRGPGVVRRRAGRGGSSRGGRGRGRSRTDRPWPRSPTARGHG